MTDPLPVQGQDFAADYVAMALRVWEHVASKGQKSFETEAAVGLQELYLSEQPDVCSETQNGPALTLTFPRLAVNSFVSWMGLRIVYWPQGIEERRRISIVSSRLGKRKDLHRSWFDALRTAIVRCDSERECLFIADGTSASTSVRRAAVLFGLPLMTIYVDSGQTSRYEDLEDWVRSTHSLVVRTDSPLDTTAFLSPMYCSPSVSSTENRCHLSAADAAVVLAGERVVTLGCRAGGNVHQLLADRLEGPDDVAVLIHNNTDCTSAKALRSLTEAGAVSWLLSSHNTDHTASPTDVTAKPTIAGSLLSDAASPLQSPEDWLCHWTRPRPGPWPGESSEDYQDALIMGCPSADHSAFAALLRIIETGRLHPSVMARNSVSFTKVPLTDFRSRRVYRRHLRRYDFEPWGIAVRQEALEGLGCRPVQYLDRGKEMPSGDECWLHQLATDSSGSIDWTAEREWRLPGPLLLDSLAVDDVFVFVDSHAEVEAMEKVSPWRVVRVPE